MPASSSGINPSAMAVDGPLNGMGKDLAEKALDNPEVDPFTNGFGLTAAELPEISLDPDVDVEDDDGDVDDVDG
jgi:hypothetical protein